MGKRILIIDDEPDILKILVARLKARGYEVDMASGGEAGLEKLNKQPPDIVLLDMMMPDMDGLEVLAAIRVQDRFKKLPVIIISAKSQKSDMDRAIGAGADDYLVKPFTAEVLVSKLALFGV